MNKVHDSIEHVIEHFKRKKPQYRELKNQVKSLLDKKLSKTDIKISGISSRIKKPISLRDKIKRNNYSDPLNEIKDFAGVRIVCGYENDFSEIEKIIYDLFKVYEKADKTYELGVDKMGYHGRHYVVSFNDSYYNNEASSSKGLYCEIQLRTVLQDSWAIASHHLLYKNEAAIPKRIRRDLNNVASILEIAQQVFDRIRDKRDDYIKEIDETTSEDNKLLSQVIDYETLRAYTKWKYPKLPVSKKWQNRLLSDLDFEKYKTLNDINIAVERAEAAVNAYKEENPAWFKTGTGHITKALGFTDPEFRRNHPFGGKTKVAFEKYKNLVND